MCVRACQRYNECVRACMSELLRVRGNVCMLDVQRVRTVGVCMSGEQRVPTMRSFFRFRSTNSTYVAMCACQRYKEYMVMCACQRYKEYMVLCDCERYKEYVTMCAYQRYKEYVVLCNCERYKEHMAMCAYQRYKEYVAMCACQRYKEYVRGRGCLSCTKCACVCAVRVQRARMCLHVRGTESVMKNNTFFKLLTDTTLPSAPWLFVVLYCNF